MTNKDPSQPVNRVLGGYELLERTSVADGVITFRARQVSLGRVVTMKVLPAASAAKPALRARFDRQVAAASRLRHDNIVSALDAGTAAGCLYVVFEELEGHSLVDAFARGTEFTTVQAIAIGLDIARALDHVATNHLIHRNVVPASILLTDHGHAKLAGFSAAKVRSTAGHETWFEHDAPTARYTAPEYVDGKKGIDIRADIYSLGCILFHLATGRPPFDKGSAPEILARHVKEAPPDPRTLRDGLPDGLVRVLDRALRKERSDRYQAPGEMVRDLELVRTGRPVERGAGTPIWKDRTALPLTSVLRGRTPKKP